MLQLFLTCLLAMGNTNTLVKKELTISLPDDFYRVTAMDNAHGHFYLIDLKAKFAGKIDARGNLLASTSSVGQGPGEFNLPRAIAVGDGEIFVGDFKKIHVYDDQFKFKRTLFVDNNPQSLQWFDGQIIAAIASFPVREHAIRIYDLDGGIKHSFYSEQVRETLIMPYLEVNDAGIITVLSRSDYRLDALDVQGNPVIHFKTKPSPHYRPIASLDAFDRKYGKSYASVMRWRTAWSEPDGIAIEKNRFVWICFKELQNDLKTSRYFVDIYDLKTGKKVAAQIEMAGPLLRGGDHAYFAVEVDDDDAYHYQELHGYTFQGRTR